MPPGSNIVEIVRRNLKERIGQSDSNKTAISRAAGMSESAIRDMLDGGPKGPTVTSLQKVAEQLGCTVADLVTENAQKQKTDDSQGEPTDGPMVSMQQHERGYMRLHLNQVVTAGQFMQIMAILQGEDDPSDDA